jgi:hypothetical protein
MFFGLCQGLSQQPNFLTTDLKKEQAMTFDLSSIRPTRRDFPIRLLVYGVQKIGKSTFASQAEDAIFIVTEDGQDNIDAEAFPLCESWHDLLSCITTLYTEDHKYKTVVLDSADWAESFAQKKVVIDAKAESIVSKGLGYGEGYRRAADLFREMLDGLNALRTQKGMQVIVLCHSDIKRFDDPLSESYDRYQLKLNNQVSKILQEWSDVIGFAQQDSTTKTEELGFGKERTRVINIDRRVLRLAGSAAFDAGNRYDLPETVPLIWANFQEALDKARKQG